MNRAFRGYVTFVLTVALAGTRKSDTDDTSHFVGTQLHARCQRHCYLRPSDR